jgi:hypothetical protein
MERRQNTAEKPAPCKCVHGSVGLYDLNGAERARVAEVRRGDLSLGPPLRLGLLKRSQARQIRWLIRARTHQQPTPTALQPQR